MTKRKLDLSHALSPLDQDQDLHNMLQEILALKEQNSPLFDSAIEDFIDKYGGSGYNSLEELLQSSAMQASYQSKEPIQPLDDLLKDLLP